MANEVIVSEYGAHKANTDRGGDIPILDESNFITSQVLNIAALSAAFDPRTKFIRLQSKGTGFWYIFGTASASAAANTAGNKWLPADQAIDLHIGNAAALRYVDTAA